MWIPAPLYKRAPLYWLFLGLFLIVTSTYLAFQMNQPSFFFGSFAGVACCAWSAMTSWKRSLYPNHSREGVTESPEKA
jgi:hypothetical protein